jgi:hypothetical protein
MIEELPQMRRETVHLARQVVRQGHGADALRDATRIEALGPQIPRR